MNKPNNQALFEAVLSDEPFQANLYSLLVGSEMNPNIIDENGHTPLYYAVQRQDPVSTIVSFLLQAGADPNLSGNDCESPLFLAVKNKDYYCANLLLDAKANPNVKDYSTGETPLTLACRQNSSYMVSELIENNADVRMRNSYFSSPLDIAKKQDVQYLQYLIKNADPTYSDEQKEKLSPIRSTENHFEFVKNFIYLVSEMVIGAFSNHKLKKTEKNKNISNTLSTSTPPKEQAPDFINAIELTELMQQLNNPPQFQNFYFKQNLQPLFKDILSETKDYLDFSQKYASQLSEQGTESLVFLKNNFSQVFEMSRQIDATLQDIDHTQMKPQIKGLIALYQNFSQFFKKSNQALKEDVLGRIDKNLKIENTMVEKKTSPLTASM